MSDNGIQKAAILLLAIGSEEASEVLRHLGPKEVQKLGAAMAALKTVSHEEIDAVLNDFEKLTLENSAIAVDSDEYLRTVLRKALGEDKADSIINRILGGRDSTGIESLKWMDAGQVADLVKNEHPQIIATILVHLERDHACGILNLFTERLRQDVILRIATLDGVQPSALRELNDVLTKLLAGNEGSTKQAMGGTRAAAEILNFMGGENETAIMEKLKEYDTEMAQRIMDEMFVFDDIIDIDDRGIQAILKEVQSEALIVALKGANPELREKIFKNMSARASEMMREDLDAKGPVRLSEVEAQQKEILQLVRRLSDEGTITLGAKGEDAYV